MQHRVRFSLCLFSLPSTMRSFARGCLTILRTTKTKRRPAPGSSSRWFSRVFFFFVKSSDSPQSPWSHPSRAWGIINDAILLTSVGRKSLGRRKESCAWFTLSWTLRIFFLGVSLPPSSFALFPLKPSWSRKCCDLQASRVALDGKRKGLEKALRWTLCLCSSSSRMTLVGLNSRNPIYRQSSKRRRFTVTCVFFIILTV